MNPIFSSLLIALTAFALGVGGPELHAADLKVQVQLGGGEPAAAKEAVDNTDAAGAADAAEAAEPADTDSPAVAKPAKESKEARDARRAARKARQEAARVRAEIEEADWKAEAPANEDRMDEIVLFGKEAHIATNQYAPVVVVLFENAVIDGRAGEVVVIGGTARINGRVREQVVSVLGRVKLGPKAWVGNQVVGVGGGVDREEGSHVGNQVVSVPLPGFEDLNFELPAAVRNSFAQLVIKARPLSFKVGWVWPVFGAIVLIHGLMVALFPKAILRTVHVLDLRPAGSILMGLAAVPLGFIVALLIAATGVGVLTWPFLFAAFVLAAIVGKAALARHIGSSVGRQFGAESIPVLPAFLIGCLLFGAFYLVPFLGLVTWMVATMWGLGGALIALFGSFRDEMPATAAGPTGPGGGGNGGGPVAGGPLGGNGFEVGSAATAPPSTAAAAAFAATTAAGVPGIGAALPGEMPTPSKPGAAPGSLPLGGLGAPEALTSIRAGFWRKLGAFAIDFALLAVATGWLLPGSFAIWLAYFAGMWGWKGTSIGGLVLGLKVVRLDGRPMDLPTGIVRALGGALGLILCFLGVLWCAWDPEKQGWHDKMAGTVVVRTAVAQTLV